MHQYRNTGVSLFELLVTLFIGLVAVSVALPVYSVSVPRIEAALKQQGLRSVIRYARVMAVQLGQPVTLCPYTPSNQCGQDWAEGYLVYRGESEQSVISADNVLRVVSGDIENYRLTLRAFPHSRSLTFLPQGYQQKQNGRFSFESKQINLRWQLVLSRTGRVKLLTS